LVCEPNASAEPISVLHLAGPDKRRAYHLRQTSGGEVLTPLTYAAIRALRENTPDPQSKQLVLSGYPRAVDLQ
jgi:hypothetical protein